MNKELYDQFMADPYFCGLSIQELKHLSDNGWTDPDLDQTVVQQIRDTIQFIINQKKANLTLVVDNTKENDNDNQ